MLFDGIITSAFCCAECRPVSEGGHLLVVSCSIDRAVHDTRFSSSTDSLMAS